MKNPPQHSDRDSNNLSPNDSALRAKKLAAMVAALGASIGVNMGEVLAGSKDIQVSETNKAAISNQTLKRPSVKTPKVEQPGLHSRPDVKTPKVERPGLQNRPDVKTPKVERPSLQIRPSVQADKVSPTLQTRPDTKSSKF